MSKKPKITIPAEVQQESQRLIGEAFRLFSDHSKEMCVGKAAFERFDDEAKERIQRGARRTSGRIV